MRPDRWHHCSAKDIEVEVCSVVPCYDHCLCVVWYWSRVYPGLLLWPTAETVKIRREDMHKWKQVA